MTCELDCDLISLTFMIFNENSIKGYISRKKKNILYLAGKQTSWLKVGMEFYFVLIFMYSRSRNKRNTPIYFNTNYCNGMKLVPIIIYYCVLQFDALKFFLEVRLHGGSVPNFIFFNVNPQIFQRNR